MANARHAAPSGRRPITPPATPSRTISRWPRRSGFEPTHASAGAAASGTPCRRSASIGPDSSRRLARDQALAGGKLGAAGRRAGRAIRMRHRASPATAASSRWPRRSSRRMKTRARKLGRRAVAALPCAPAQAKRAAFLSGDTGPVPSRRRGRLSHGHAFRADRSRLVDRGVRPAPGRSGSSSRDPDRAIGDSIATIPFERVLAEALDVVEKSLARERGRVKIGIFLPNATFDLPGSPEVGGIETFSFTVGEALQRLGHEVVLFGGAPKAGPPSSRHDADAGAASLLGNAVDSRHRHALPAAGAAASFRAGASGVRGGGSGATWCCWPSRSTGRWRGGGKNAARSARGHGLSRHRFFRRRPPLLRRGRRRLRRQSARGRSGGAARRPAPGVDSQSGRCRFFLAEARDAAPTPRSRGGSSSSGRLVGWKGFANLVEAVALLAGRAWHRRLARPRRRGPERAVLGRKSRALRLGDRVTLRGLLDAPALRDLLRSRRRLRAALGGHGGVFHQRAGGGVHRAAAGAFRPGRPGQISRDGGFRDLFRRRMSRRWRRCCARLHAVRGTG